MTATHTRLEFAPPPTKGLLRALGLAILSHGLLLSILTLGVQWKRDAAPVTVQAELWSALPVEAAPSPAPELPAAEPEPQPLRVVTPVTEPPPTVPDPSIVVAKEKARLQKQKQLEREKQEQELRQKEALKARKLKEEKESRQARERELAEKLVREKNLQAAQAAKSDAEAKKLAEMRKQQMERMSRLAGAAVGNGASDATGSAKQSSGPSASYAGRIAARIKPNITYTEVVVGNPTADVEVRTSPDGTIISRKLVKSSGIKSWDDAVLSAIDKTEKLPPDTDGRVIASLTLGFRPKD
jgi:colicin import membrane protein